MDNRQFWARMGTESLLNLEHEAYIELSKRVDKAIELLKNNADPKEVIEVLEEKR